MYTHVDNCPTCTCVQKVQRLSPTAQQALQGAVKQLEVSVLAGARVLHGKLTHKNATVHSTAMPNLLRLPILQLDSLVNQQASGAATPYDILWISVQYLERACRLPSTLMANLMK